MANNRKLLLIIPSSIIFFLLVPWVSITFGKRLDSFFGLNGLDLGVLGVTLSLLLLLVGGYYVLESIRVLFAEGRGIPLGDVFPEDQSTELITTGVYSQTRNPMLFGYLLCLMASGLLMRSFSMAFIIPIVFIIIWTVWLKTKEEPALENRFGATYMEYKKRTPYLVPKPRRKDSKNRA